MFGLNRNRFLVVLSFVLLISASAASRPRKMQRLTTGTWGGPNIRVEVESRSATINYSCAHGTIDGPFNLDSKGRFTWRGFHKREGPGPVRIDDDGNGIAAIYTGSVKGDKM